MERFDIYLRGFMGGEPAEAGLQRVFGIDARRAAELVRSLPRVVKRDVPGEHAERYRRALTAIRADFELRRSPIRPQSMIFVSGSPSPASDDLELPPSGWSQPPPAPQGVPHAVQALGATWSESQPPPRGPGSATDIGSWPAAPHWPAHDGLAPEPPASQARPLSGTLREAQPPMTALGAAQPYPKPVTLPESLPPPPTVPAAVTYRYAPEPQPSSVGAYRSTAEATAPIAAGHRFSAEPIPLSDDAVPPGAVPLSLAPPAPATAALSAAPPVAAPEASSAPGLSSAWAPIPLEELKPAPVGGPPAAWHASALDLDIRSGYLLDTQSAFARDTEGGAHAGPDPFDPPPSLAPVARKPARSRDPSAFAVQWTGTPSAEARESRAPQTARPGPTAAVAVGLVAGRELTASAEPPPFVRWMLRAGMGLSLFVIVTTTRHCRALETGVDDALAGWGQRAEDTSSAAGVASSGSQPAALIWLASDLNTVSTGDEDRVRGLVQRLAQAGADDVYIGKITQMGMAQIAHELIVDLPADPARRRAVVDVYDKYMSVTFGGIDVATAVPAGDKLHITL